MAKPETLRPATFRGIQFFVRVGETQGGRRNILHEYPYKDEPYTEDLGRKAREYTFDAYVIGEDHEDIRRRLLEAIEKNDSPGTLVHPLFGSVRVIPGPVRHRYDNTESNIEYFTLTFFEAGENRFPDASLDTRAAVNESAERLQTATITAFVENYRISEVPEFVILDAEENAKEMVETITQSIDAVQLEPAQSPDFQAELEEYRKQITDLAHKPVAFAQKTTKLLGMLEGVFTRPENAFATYRRLWQRADDRIPVWKATPSRQRMRQNREVQMGMIKRLCVVGMAKAATRMNFESYDQAVRFKEELTEMMEAELFRLGQPDYDNLFFALEDIRAQVIRDLTERSVNLDRLRHIQLSTLLPTMVVSYDLYGTAERADEIRTRNRVRHPLFVPAGEPLQVLVT